MNFFGDYCLGGNEVIKVAEYQIRQVPKLTEKELNKKAYYPDIFTTAAEGKIEPRDWSFWQDVAELKLWHEDMPELAQC